MKARVPGLPFKDQIKGDPAQKASQQIKIYITVAKSGKNGIQNQDNPKKEKMQRIQSEVPAWIQKSGQQARVMPLMEKIKSLTKDKQWQEADKVADEILSLLPPGEKK